MKMAKTAISEALKHVDISKLIVSAVSRVKLLHNFGHLSF